MPAEDETAPERRSTPRRSPARSRTSEDDPSAQRENAWSAPRPHTRLDRRPEHTSEADVPEEQDQAELECSPTPSVNPSPMRISGPPTTHLRRELPEPVPAPEPANPFRQGLSWGLAGGTFGLLSVAAFNASYPGGPWPLVLLSLLLAISSLATGQVAADEVVTRTGGSEGNHGIAGILTGYALLFLLGLLLL